MSRGSRVREIERALGHRTLVWFGTRGADAISLLEIDAFTKLFSIIAPLRSAAIETELCLESLKRERVDLDTYTIDKDDSEEAAQFHRTMFTSLGEPSAVAVYRPNAFFTSIYFPRMESVQYLGLFHEHQVMFEHKPWVESGLRAAGVRVIPWRYFGDEDRARLLEALASGPHVLRTTRSDGGVGLRIAHDPADLDAQWPEHGDWFVGAAPYLEPNVPLNVNACVFGDGSVSLHGPSVQLIGIPQLTNLPLGYCGNDFTLACELDDRVLDELEALVARTGSWLASKGYLGAFGIDALLYRGELYLTEVNPRFQGSSAVSIELDRALDRPDLFFDHIAAFLGLPAPTPLPLRELARCTPPRAQLIAHNLGDQHVRILRDPSDADGPQCELIPDSTTQVHPRAAMFRGVFKHGITRDGFTLSPEVADQVQRWITGTRTSPDELPITR